MAKERGTRKLAAIMFTDIKSFSKKMAESEDLAMQLLRVHDDTLKAAIDKYEGKIIKAIGDAFMVDFSSAVNALKCAIESQEEFYKYNKGKKELEKIEVRIGIHLGDVITDGNDIFGDGVNIAARIEAVTEPNRICISQDVYSQIKNKMQVKTYHMGSIELKNIPEPMEVYEILLDNIPEFATPSKSAQQMPSKRSAERATKREAKEAAQIELAKKKGEEDKQKSDTAEKVQKIFVKAEALFKEGKLDDAEKEVTEIFKHVGFHAGAQSLQSRIEEEKRKIEEEERKKAAAQRKVKQQVGELMEEALKFVDENKFAEADSKLKEIFAIDSSDEDAKALEEKVKEGLKKAPPAAPKEEPKPEPSRAPEREPESPSQAVVAEPSPEPVPEAAEEAAPQQASPQRRRAGLKQRQKHLSPWIKKLIVVGIVGIVGYVLFPTIQKILFPLDSTLVVVPFTFAGQENDTLGAAIASVLEEDLSMYKELVLVRTGNLEGKKPTASQLAGQLHARFVVTGQITSLSPTFLARIRLSNPGDNIPSEEWTVEDGSYSLNVLRTDIVSRVFRHLGLEPEAKELQPLSGNASINDAYLRASWHSSQSNRDDLAYAESLFRRILIADSDFSPAHTGLGRTLIRLFKADGERDKSLLREAADEAIKARSINPNSAAALEVLATAYRAAGRVSLAEKTLDQLLEMAPGNAQAQRQYSLLLLAEGDYDGAFRYASKAVLLDPNNAESQEVMGHAYYFKQQMVSAEKAYDRAISIGGNSYFLTTRYKLAVWGAGLSPEPVAQYGNRLLRDDPTNYVVQYWVGRAYMLSGLWQEAKKYLEPGAESLKEVLKLSPSEVNALLYLGLYYARLGESANGLVEIDKALELSGGSAIAKYRKAQFYAIQSDKKKEALEWLQQAVRQEFILSEVMSPDFAFLVKDPGFAQAIVLSATVDAGE